MCVLTFGAFIYFIAQIYEPSTMMETEEEEDEQFAVTVPTASCSLREAEFHFFLLI